MTWLDVGISRCHSCSVERRLFVCEKDTSRQLCSICTLAEYARNQWSADGFTASSTPKSTERVRQYRERCRSRGVCCACSSRPAWRRKMCAQCSNRYSRRKREQRRRTA